jgi:uncharacterized phage-associated protein
MFTALEVAKQLISLEDGQDEPFYFSPLRLQKMLYFCQGWSLALFDKPLFDERFEAWPNGPVVRSVYEQFRGTKDPILASQIGPPSRELTDRERHFLEMILERYAALPTGRLIDITHGERPWLDARGNLKPQEKCDIYISDQSIAKTFTEKIQHGGLSHAELQAEWAEVDPDPSTSRPAQDLFNELLAECA